MARIALVLILFLLYLRFVGFPGMLVRRVCDWLAGQELYVQVRRVRIDFPASIVVEGLRLYDVPDADIPLLEMGSMDLRFRPSYWLKRRAGFSGLNLRGAVLRVNTAGTGMTDKGPQTLVLEDVNAILGFEAAGIRVEEYDAEFVGIHVHGTGFIVALERPEDEKLSLRDISRTIKAALKDLPPWLPAFAEQLNAVEFAVPPKAELQLHFTPAEPLLTEMQMAVMGRETQVRGVRLDRWSAHVALRDGILRFGPASLIQGETYCHASGTLNLRDRIADGHIYSTLSPQAWLSLVPRRWYERSASEGIVFQGSGSFEVWLGPASVEKLLESMSGWAALDETVYRDVWIERAFAQFKKEGDLATFSRVEATIGRDAQRSTMKGSATLDFGTLEYAVQGSGECDPRAALPLLTPNQEEIISALEFNVLPKVDGRISGVVTNLDAFGMAVQIGARDLSFRGVEMVRFDSEMVYSNDAMSFRDMKVERPEGRVDGWVRMDYDRNVVEYDVVSTADPYEVGKILGSNIHAFVSQFRIEGPVRVESRGRVDYKSHTDTDLEAQVTAQRVGMDWLLVDRGVCRIRAEGTRIEFSGIEGTVYGGTFSGSAAIWDVNDPEDIRYEVSGEINNANFRRLMESMREVNGDIYQGTLSTTVTVMGVIGKGKGPTVTGAGRMEIRKGTLFQVPLLGGLSQILSRVYPGLGFATQTDFTSAFTIADSRVRAENAFLEGTVISVSASGSYYFDERLDMRVHVKLLRRGPIASVLRTVTFPVTKLLELHLGGTLGEPRWRPHNLPKELFLMFD